MLNKKNIVLMVIAVIIVLGIGFWVKKANNNDYSVVYLSTGEVYVGQLSAFPDFELKNGYILQIAKDATDPTKSNFQIQPVKDALWATENLHINRENVVFYGTIMSDSVIGKKLAEQK